ncbi:MAG: peptidase [Frankiales bacterium]|nr:peptidase [Frankiales bacterium]
MSESTPDDTPATTEQPGSYRAELDSRGTTRPLDPQARVEATLVLRRRAEPTPADLSGAPLSAAELEERFGADPADVQRVQDGLSAAGIDVLSVDPASRRMRISAPVDRLNKFFGTQLDLRTVPVVGRGDVEVRHRSGSLQLPVDLEPVVVAVLGLDNRPQARSRYLIAQANAVTTSYTPLDLARVYEMPEGTDGSGQTLAIIELGGGFGPADLDAYFGGLGLATPSVRAVGVDGAENQPGQDPSGADGEVLLDIEVAGGIAPAADLVVYFAPNTDDGFLDAVSTAAHASPTPTAMSISWGQSEDQWTEQARTAMDQAFADASLLGVTVTVAAGDDGSTDRATDQASHVDFPASSPHVLACGGTSLHADPSSGSVSSETVWNNNTSASSSGGGATGGGVSTAFPLPDWQQSAGVPAPTPASGTGRGVPDVAADADPRTGYQVLVDGQATVIGGTSAVAPLWAGLVCRLAQGLGTKLGLLQPKLYAGLSSTGSVTGFRDITQGNNGAFEARPGWDACTGLGVPIGTDLLAELQR